MHLCVCACYVHIHTFATFFMEIYEFTQVYPNSCLTQDSSQFSLSSYFCLSFGQWETWLSLFFICLDSRWMPHKWAIFCFPFLMWIFLPDLGSDSDPKWLVSKGRLQKTSLVLWPKSCLVYFQKFVSLEKLKNSGKDFSIKIFYGEYKIRESRLWNYMFSMI